MLRLNLSKKVTIMTKEKIFNKDPKSVQAMFNLIADKYDFLNDAMSLGTHNSIKYQSIKNLDIKSRDRVIDICCGTGDLARIIKQIEPDADVTGIDFSEKMLEIALSKNKNNQIEYLQGDVTNLPYPDNTFDFAVMGFGLRNIQNTEKAVEEVYRILKPGGYFMHLDFGKHNFLSKIFDITTPILSRIFTKNYSAYSYLIKSKQIFLEPEDLIKDFESKRFKLKKREDFLSGVISSQILYK